MALSYFNPNTTYNAPSFEEMMIPYKFVQERRDKYLQELANTQDTATLINALVPEGDPAKDTYESFNEELLKVRDDFMQTGYNADSLNRILELKHKFTEQIAPIELATKKLAAIKAEDQKLRSQNPTIIPSIDTNNLTVSQLIQNPHLTVQHIEGNKVSSLVSTMLQNMSKQLLNGNIPEVIQTNPALLSVITQYGYTPEALMEAMNTDSSFLNLMLGQVQSLLGIDGPEWENAKPRILSAMNIGTTSTLGITDVKTMDDPIFAWNNKMRQQQEGGEEPLASGDHNINLIDMAFPNASGLDVNDKPINLLTDANGEVVSDNPNAPLPENTGVGIGNFSDTMYRMGFATDKELRDMKEMDSQVSLFSKDGKLLTPDIIKELKLPENKEKAMLSAFNVLTKYVASMGHSFKDIDLESFRYLNNKGIQNLNRLQIKVMEMPFSNETLYNIIHNQVDELKRPVYKVSGFKNGQMQLTEVNGMNAESLTNDKTNTSTFISLLLPGKLLINTNDATYAINIANTNDVIYKNTLSSKNAYDSLYANIYRDPELASYIINAEKEWANENGKNPSPLERIQLKEYIREKFLNEHPTGRMLKAIFNNSLKTLSNNINNTINSKYNTSSISTANTTKQNEIQ